MVSSTIRIATVAWITATLAVAAFVSGPQLPSGITQNGQKWGAHNVCLIYDFGMVNGLFSCDSRSFVYCSIAEVPLRTFCYGLLFAQPFCFAAMSRGNPAHSKQQIGTRSLFFLGAVTLPALLSIAAIWFNQRHAMSMDWTCWMTQALMIAAILLSSFIVGITLRSMTAGWRRDVQGLDSAFLRYGLIGFSCTVGLASVFVLPLESLSEASASSMEDSGGFRVLGWLSFLVASFVLRTLRCRVGTTRVKCQIALGIANLALLVLASASHGIFSVDPGSMWQVTVGHGCFFLGAQLGLYLFPSLCERPLRFSLRTALIGSSLIALSMLFYSSQSTESVFLAVCALFICSITAAAVLPRSTELVSRTD